MKHLAIAFVAGVFCSGIALAQLSDTSRDNDRKSDRDQRRHRYQHEHDRQYPQGVTRPGDANPYASKAGAPDPYAPVVGAPNPYATRGGDPPKPLSNERPRPR